jgi:hypothetical protein
VTTRPGADPERLLSQALRAQVGGPRTGLGTASGPPAAAADAPSAGAAPGRWERFTTAQILLMAAIVGLIIGMGTGLAVVLLR